MKKLILLLFLVVLSSIAFAQETATVFIARKKVYTGAMGPTKVFIDAKLVCQINNNSYSVHTIPAGKHTFSVQWGGKESKDVAEKNSVEVDVHAGKEYYFKTDTETKNLIQYLVLEEIAVSGWPKLKNGLKQDDCL